MPTRFNDGSLVPSTLVHDTYEEVVARFGAVTIETQTIRGIWTNTGRRYEDENLRFSVEAEDTPENAQFFRRWKETLKLRFRQIDIWIVSYEVRIT